MPRTKEWRCRVSAILATSSSGSTRNGARTGSSSGFAASCRTFPRSFIEFGVESFAEANTRFLIENRGWRGLVLDGNKDYMEALRKDALYWRHDLTAVPAFITAENINGLIRDADFAGSIGILSVDIDGNDYWVLEAIDCVDPAIIICEINGVFGDLRADHRAIPARLPANGRALFRPVFRLLDRGGATALFAQRLQLHRDQHQRRQCLLRSRRPRSPDPCRNRGSARMGATPPRLAGP